MTQTLSNLRISGTATHITLCISWPAAATSSPAANPCESFFEAGKWMHYRLVAPKDQAAASILRETLKHLKAKPDMRHDV